MVEAGVGETFGVVDLLVQTDDGGHVVLPEVGEVSLGGMEGITCRWGQPQVLMLLVTLQVSLTVPGNYRRKTEQKSEQRVFPSSPEAWNQRFSVLTCFSRKTFQQSV